MNMKAYNILYKYYTQVASNQGGVPTLLAMREAMTEHNRHQHPFKYSKDAELAIRRVIMELSFGSHLYTQIDEQAKDTE